MKSGQLIAALKRCATQKQRQPIARRRPKALRPEGCINGLRGINPLAAPAD